MLDSFDRAAAQQSGGKLLGCGALLILRSRLYSISISSAPSAGPGAQEGLNQCDGTYRLIANQYWFYFSMFDYMGLQMNCTFK